MKQRKEIDVLYITEIYEKRKVRRQIASVPMGLGIFDPSSVLLRAFVPFGTKYYTIFFFFRLYY